MDIAGTSRILVVDDDPLVILLATTLLVDEGYEVIQATTGNECLEAVHAHHPDIILLDVMLPDMTGFEVCRQIKTDESTQGSLVILSSGALVSPGDQAEGLNIGADGYLVKPYSKKEFLARIRSMERIKQAEHALRASEERYRRLFESSQDGILILDGTTGQIDDINPSLIRILGYDRGELVGKKIWEIGLFEDGEVCKTAFVELQHQGHVRHGDVQFTTKTRRKIYVECVSLTYTVNDRTAILCNIHDITARKEAENETLLTNMRQKALLQLYQMADAPQEEVVAFAVEACARLTESQLCSIGFTGKDGTIADYQCWSSKAMQAGAMDLKPAGSIIGDSGLWAETIGGRKPFVINDYPGLNPHETGLPEGHIPIERFMGIPIVDGECVAVVAGLANKPQPYNESDVFHITMLLNSMLSIIRQRAAEKAVRESEEKYRVLLDNASDAIIIADSEANFLEVNKRAESLLGYGREELRGMNIRQIHTKDDLQDVIPVFSRISEGKSDSILNTHIVRKDGKLVPVDISGSLIEYGGKMVAQGIFRDATERAQIEEERQRAHSELERMVEERTAQLSQSNRLLGQQILERDAIAQELEQSSNRLQSLNARLRIAREEERTFLSRELHDGLGQILTAMGMDMFWLSKNLPPKDRQAHDRVKSLSNLIDEAILSVQKLSGALRHSIKGGFSLTNAIKTTAGEFEKRTGILCEFLSEPATMKLDGDVSTETFRIFQEALTNIARHSGAKKVTVFLQKRRDQLIMDVRDDGKGITKRIAASRVALGLNGMRERAFVMGGSITITGVPQKGTTVTLRVPLDKGRQGRSGKKSRLGIPAEVR